MSLTWGRNLDLKNNTIQKNHPDKKRKKTKTNTFEAIYDDEDLLDFKIVVKSEEGTKKSVSFHRAVLSAWSPVFRKMFSVDWKEKVEGEVELPLKISVIEALKKFVYLDELPEDRQMLLGLVELGSYYMVERLETDAVEEVVHTTYVDNFYETLEFAMSKKLNKLTAALLKHTRNLNVDDIARRLVDYSDDASAGLNKENDHNGYSPTSPTYYPTSPPYRPTSPTYNQYNEY